MPELVVVDQILLAQRDAEHALRQQCLDRMLNQIGRTPIGKASRKPPDQADRPVGRAEQQGASGSSSAQ